MLGKDLSRLCLMLALALLFGFSGVINPRNREVLAQGKASEIASSSSTEKTKPAITRETKKSFNDLIGVSLGMSAEEVRDKLEKLKNKSDQQDFFVLSGSKTAQVYYNADGKVIAFSIDYLGKGEGVPTPEMVIGEAVQPKADGSIYQLKRYPEAGYWVAYNRTAGENPVTTVTVQSDK